MNFQYKFKLDVPVAEAWAVLMDVYRVAPCLPGAAIESGEDGDYVGRVKVKLGPIEMTYRGDVKFAERNDAARHAVINVAAKEIKGGGAAKATMTLDVAAAGTGSEVSVGSEFTVSGKAAQFGRGVMDEVGEKLMSEFAARLSALIAADRQAAPAAAAPAALQTPDAQDGATTPQPALRAVSANPSAPREDEVLDVMAAAKGAIMRRVAMVIAGLVVIGGASALALHAW